MKGIVIMNTTRNMINLNPQLVREIYEEAKKYDGVLDLTLGDPDIKTPEFIIRETIAALENNKTKYTANSGMAELRRAISEDVYKRTGIRYDADSEITVTAGAMGALFLASRCILAPGDEMIILEPNWPNYVNMVRMCGAKEVIVSLFEDNIIEKIRTAVSDKTRAIIINSPSNPTGLVLPWDMLCEIAAIAKENDLYVISDEVYHSIVFDMEYKSILEIEGMKERTILVDSMSKRFSMTGYRVGFMCAQREIAYLSAQLQENVNSCACMFAQAASAIALENCEQAQTEITEIFKDRCTSMVAELNKSPYLDVPSPTATFYLFFDITKTKMSSYDFTVKLLRSKHIAVVPGNAFGRTGEGYIRIACTLSTEKLVAAAKQIVAFINEECGNN